MTQWIYLAGSGLLTGLAVFAAWVVVSRRQSAFDLEPVSQHWLAERKKVTEAE